MKYLICLILTYCLISCGNKEKIVEEIKKAKDKRSLASINHGYYDAAATHLRQFETAPADQKQVYKEAYDKDKQYLKGESAEILNDYKKLDSVALIWEMKSRDAQRKIDSLELELKKY